MSDVSSYFPDRSLKWIRNWSCNSHIKLGRHSKKKKQKQWNNCFGSENENKIENRSKTVGNKWNRKEKTKKLSSCHYFYLLFFSVLPSIQIRHASKQDKQKMKTENNFPVPLYH